MDHVICINQNSFPAINKTIGVELFDNAIQGVLQLQNNDDRFIFYLDSNESTLSDFEISKNFTYTDFINDCEDPDISLFLSEVEDKSPALDSLSEEQIEEMSSYTFYIHNQPVDNFPDVYALTWILSGHLLSIKTHDRWGCSNIKISRTSDLGIYLPEEFSLKNISCPQHGAEHNQETNSLDINQVIFPHKLTTNLSNWFLIQNSENKSRIIAKLQLACERNFQGSKPLFDTLTDGGGLREIRFSAYAGGAIRILFRHLKDNQHALLVGFIKHSDSEHYSKAIPLANELYQEIQSSINE
ncbi:TPA: type II toxin-antitoxin system RelE/ParE family toxin [Morganella morganii]